MAKEEVRLQEYKSATGRAEKALAELKKQADGARGTVDGLSARAKSELTDLEALRASARAAVEESESELSRAIQQRRVEEEKLGALRREALESEKARSNWQRTDEVGPWWRVARFLNWRETMDGSTHLSFRRVAFFL